MYCSKGTCEGLCTTVRVHVRVCVPAQNPFTYLHCTPHPHTSQLHLIHTHSLTALHYTHTPHSLHSTHPHSLHSTHTLSLTVPPSHLPNTHSSPLQIQGAKDSPKLCPPQSFCGTVSGSLCVCWGRLVPQGVRSTYLCACACVCVCVCVCVRACVRACVCV